MSKESSASTSEFVLIDFLYVLCCGLIAGWVLYGALVAAHMILESVFGVKFTSM